ncbi:DUF4229 domain-containing protein [Actinopolymorpha singaporensis]|uniref:DUF4229 domain-containing protein n=1 Tax=Actinopolymorpha singaporensis TaxID=117157 RepID=A0A1H1QQI6_9ACTN|nr:DUF4229 domain-containing protein [Actinopolymorpha singaporensis]SDS25583.1 Protein of unknown function [Actinopolymorpha singaporensis]
MRTFLVYTLLRLVIFLACFGVLYVLFGAHVSGWLIALPAVLFTSGLSWLLLRQRGVEAGAALSSGWRSARGRLEASTRREDAES